jgi:hypothetical protein
MHGFLFNEKMIIKNVARPKRFQSGPIDSAGGDIKKGESPWHFIGRIRQRLDDRLSRLERSFLSRDSGSGVDASFFGFDYSLLLKLVDHVLNLFLVKAGLFDQ